MYLILVILVLLLLFGGGGFYGHNLGMGWSGTPAYWGGGSFGLIIIVLILVALFR